ncbi:MAG TPA: formate/nitrite transporter family protein [bacterium]|uniref:Putative formate transporter 1 n=1 Tax=candidate division TA06 bacterium ADurb.Bin417 TaxID=1852828 RepID=A0A1V5MJL8_UNCT6|nr:MAG: putative formate transporter 1 [candidate division TA06 bacterium ADurb.Bin417]HNQ36008.1 formate/nitrite transporter family protein [bacterium]HNS48525.1 formate/nitrite transporter family protein [bacterium]
MGERLERTLEAAELKGRLSLEQLLILGFLAGAYIGFGALLSLVAASGWHPGFGLERLAMGAAFSLGLILVVGAGAELFTGNCLLVTANCSGRLCGRATLRNWGWVYLANLAGSVFLAAVVYLAGLHLAFEPAGLARKALEIARAKATLPFWTAFWRGVLCNWLVCLAVWMAAGTRDFAGKVLAVFFPVLAFVAMGFEHSVANMFFIPYGLFLSTVPLPGLDLRAFLVGNLLPVTLGNLAGGAFFVGFLYHRAESAGH